jgi:hypothetical protein
MRHQDLTINHRLESWVYANAAARTGATGFVAGDVGRISYQTDTGQYWRLTATTPTWQLIVPPVAAPVYASLQTTQLNPTGTATVTPGKMMGLAVGNAFTPTASGKVLVTITGYLSNSTTSAPGLVMRYGTSTPPANGAAPSGTIIGPGCVVNAGFANQTAPFSVTHLFTGLTVGTPYWFDVSIYSASGTASIAGVTISAEELP